jgi:hypothetical protein
MTTIKKPRDYSKGIVYKLCCLDTSVLEVYVGSTICFNKRKAAHKCHCTTPGHRHSHIRVYQFIRENGGWDNWQMVQIEAYAATSKRDLESRERDCMERFSVTLNTILPARREETVAEARKARYQANKAYVSEQHKVYYQENRAAISEQQKVYYQENRAAISEYRKNWYQEKKKKKKMPCEKVTCDCGSIFNRSSVTRHNKTKKHKRYLSDTYET